MRFSLGRSLRSFVTFLDLSVSRAMGCFIGCFRAGDDDDVDRRRRRDPRRRSPVDSQHRDVIESKNCSPAVLLSEEEHESQCKDGGDLILGSPQINELREQARILKACGAIIETPAELRKTSQKFKASPPCDMDSEPSEFNSWVPNASMKKMQLEIYPDESATPIKIFEEFPKGTESSEHTPSSCISNAQNSEGLSISFGEGSGKGSSVSEEFEGKTNEADDITSPVSPMLLATKDRYKNKSVRFECDLDKSSSRSSSGNGSQSSKNFDSPSDRSVSKISPYPTPVKLSDEMQTPGTVFGTNMEDIENGKKTRIRSQYVYSVLNPVVGVKEEGPNPNQLESVVHSENGTPKSKELMSEGSLSSTKPVMSPQDTDVDYISDVASRNPHFGRTPGDRPIIGMVAAHWNEDGSSCISPKWWDGNGIPNSTNKYKEDQKVSWHATPFEVRLEKALSEENGPPQRNRIINGKPIVFEEDEETDTGLSQFQASTHHVKSVVSF